MRADLVRVSSTPSWWAACRKVGSRRPVVAWAVFENEDGGEIVGMIAKGSTLMRADRLPGFCGYAAGQGCEPTLNPPELPAPTLDHAMLRALAGDVGWNGYPVRAEVLARIRAVLESAAQVEWATIALNGFTQDPRRWFFLWLQSRREHVETERVLWSRLVALSRLGPRGASLEQLLDIAGTTLGRSLRG